MRRIALMTDFGTRDPYVASMKGVIASRTDAPVVDLTHEIAPFDVLEGAWFLATAARWWPEGTIFVCVVDPGVGTARRIVAFVNEGRVFLAPDNGLLTFVRNNPSSAFGTFSEVEVAFSPPQRGEGARSADEGSSFFSVENSSLFLPSTSTTFHGRDRFAPVAAALANGLPLAELGPRIERIVTLDYEPPRYSDNEVHGTVVAIDRFGNVITDIEAARVPFISCVLRVDTERRRPAGWPAGVPPALSPGRRRDAAEPAGEDAGVPLRLELNYGDAGEGPFLIIGSTGHLEISIANASAANHLRIERLQRVELRPL